MYAIASQVWATPFLRQGKEKDDPLQNWLMTVLKRIFMVKDTTPPWCVMCECGLDSRGSTVQLVPGGSAAIKYFNPKP